MAEFWEGRWRIHGIAPARLGAFSALALACSWRTAGPVVAWHLPDRLQG